MKYISYLTLTLLSILILPANAELIQRKEVTLPITDISILENLACKTPFKLKAETIQGFKDEHAELKSDFSSAYVTCKSHGKFMASPIYYQTFCEINNGKWKCNISTQETTINLGKQNVTIRPSNISFEAAYKTLNQVSGYGRFQGISMQDAIGSSCDISQLDKETIELSCRYKIAVSTWCPQPQLTKCPRVVSVTEQPIP